MSEHATAAVPESARPWRPRRLLRARRPTRPGLAQLLCAVAGFALGLALLEVSGGPTVAGGQLAAPLFTLGIGVVGIVSLVYSLLFGVVQWSASSYSPRLTLFRGDPLVWWTFAFTIGVFVYCVTAGLASLKAVDVSVLVPVVGVVGALLALALIRTLQIRAFQSLQLAYVLRAVTADGLAVIDAVYPLPPTSDEVAPEASASLPPRRRTVSWTDSPGVVQQLELRPLIDAVARANAIVVFRVGVGHRLHDGSLLADIHGGGDLPDTVVRQAVLCAQERSHDQDPMFALRLLADIGLRALSPAVNDPATAVDALDAIEDLLRVLAPRNLAVADWVDTTGELRVRLVLPGWDDYLRTGVEDMLPAAEPFPMVLQQISRMLAALLELSPPSAHPAVFRLQKQVAAGLATSVERTWRG